MHCNKNANNFLMCRKIIKNQLGVINCLDCHFFTGSWGYHIMDLKFYFLYKMNKDSVSQCLKDAIHGCGAAKELMKIDPQ